MSDKATAPYRVKGTNIRHQKKTYPHGSQIELAAEDARRLKAFLAPLDGGESSVAANTVPPGMIMVAGADLERFQCDLETLVEQVDQLKEQVATKDATISALNGQLAASDEANQTLAKVLTERDQAIDTLTEAGKVKDQTIAEFEVKIVELQKQLPKGGKK